MWRSLKTMSIKLSSNLKHDTAKHLNHNKISEWDPESPGMTQYHYYEICSSGLYISQKLHICSNEYDPQEGKEDHNTFSRHKFSDFHLMQNRAGRKRLTWSRSPYPENTYKRFLICIEYPSRRGTGADGILSHSSSGAGRSAKVDDKYLSEAFFLFSSLTFTLYEQK